MQNNLPEIGFQEKKEKKGGFWGWLRGRGGFFSRGGLGGQGVNPSGMNFARYVGSGKFGPSSYGLAAMFSGHAGTAALVALLGAACGIYVIRNSQSTVPVAAVFSQGKGTAPYIPAILRNQNATHISSLDILKEANRDFAKDRKEEQPGSPLPPPPAVEDSSAGQAQPVPNQRTSQEIIAQLQSGGIGSLTSSLDGGSNKFSGIGGFSNKFGGGQTGLKTGFTTGIGSGFSAMPKFGERKGRMLAMKGSARPVFASSNGGKSAKVRPGAFGQAQALRATQKSYTGSEIDSLRSTQDKAWEGATGEGDVSGGAGIGSGGGGAGIVTSPSLDNSSSGAGTGKIDDAVPPDAVPPSNVSPWAGLLSKAMMMILFSAALSAIGAMLITKGRALMGNPLTAAIGIMLYMLGMMMCIMALMMAVMAMMIGIQVMTSFGQMLLGSVYLMGGGVAMAGAIMAMSGSTMGAITPLWMSAIAGVIALMASMFAV